MKKLKSIESQIIAVPKQRTPGQMHNEAVKMPFMPRLVGVSGGGHGTCAKGPILAVRRSVQPWRRLKTILRVLVRIHLWWN